MHDITEMKRQSDYNNIIVLCTWEVMPCLEKNEICNAVAMVTHWFATFQRIQRGREGERERER